MTPKRQADKTSSRARMRVARKRLQEANDAMIMNNYDSVCNRCYYAIFEATHAMLAAKEIDQPVSHRGLRHQFNIEIVNQELCDNRIAEHFSRIETNRNLADYAETDIGRNRATTSLLLATEFIDTTPKILKKIRRAVKMNEAPSPPPVRLPPQST